MKQKLYFLVAGFALGISTVSLASSFFSDVNENAYYAQAISSIVRKGLMNGYEYQDEQGFTFGPDDSLTRGQLALVLERYDKHILNTLRFQYGLKLEYVCPSHEFGDDVCAGGGPEGPPLGHECRNLDYLNWIKLNCEGYIEG